MFPDPDGRESPAWDEMMARAAEFDASLRAGPPFTVFGLQLPTLRPQVLAGSQWSGGVTLHSPGGSVEHRHRPFDGWELVELFYGDGFASMGPAVSVRTQVSVASHVETELEEVLADERDRLFEHAGIDERVTTPSERTAATIEIDGAPVEFRVLTQGSLWCATATVPPGGDVSFIITIVGRAVPLAQVRLARVPDLGPFIDARDEWLERVSAARAAMRATADLSVPAGEPAVRALIEYLHPDGTRDGRRRSGSPMGDQPRRPSGLRSVLWEAAVDHQASSWDIDRTLANEQVASLVNHLGWMSEHLVWFGESVALRSAAIDETIAYVTRGVPVTSRPAQRAWASLWAGQLSRSSPSLDRGTSAEAVDRLQQEIRERSDLQTRWSDLWLGWAAGQSDGSLDR